MTRDGAGSDSERDKGNADGDAVRESIDTAGVNGEGIPNVSAAAEASGKGGVTTEESESDNSDDEVPKSRKRVRRGRKTRGFNEGILERDTLQLLESR